MVKRLIAISYHTCPLTDEKEIEIGGMNTYVLELSKELAKKGYIVDIFTRAVDKNPKIISVSSNLRVIHLSAGEQMKIPNRRLIRYIPEFLKNLYKFLDEQDKSYDLISCHYYLSGLIGLNLKKKYKIPMVMTFHTLALMKNLVARGKEEKEDLRRIKAEMLLMQESDKIIATSDPDAEYTQTLYNCSPQKIFVLTPGVNFELFKPFEKSKAKSMIKANPDHKLILFVGRIVPLKGIDMLIYALKILMENNPKLRVCLWIVGDKRSNELKRLEEIKKILKITTFVKFIGQKKQEELPFYYNSSEMVIMPSQYESFGIIALEAMACGIPVIATDATGISNLFDKNHHSLITSAGNPILLSRKIENLLSDKNKYKKLSQEVLDKVKDFSWSNVTNRFIEILKA